MQKYTSEIFIPVSYTHLDVYKRQISYSLFETIYHHKQHNHPLITIGTTSTRSIESLPQLYQLIREDIGNYLSDSCRARRDTISQSCQNSDFLLIISINSDTITFSSRLFIYP